MSNKISEKIVLITRTFAVLTVGFLSSLTIAMGMGTESDPLEQSSSQQKLSLIEHLADQHQPEEHPAHKYQAVHLAPLTEILHQDAHTAWTSVVASFAEKDFLLSGLNTFRHLTNNDLLNRLNIDHKDWKTHVIAVGGLLEEKIGNILVTNANFGSPIKNLMDSHYQITVLSPMKALGYAYHEAQKTDSTLKDAAHSATDIIKTYLETHGLLTTI